MTAWLDPHTLAMGVFAFCFGYPFVMSMYWIAGSLLHRLMRERFEPLPEHPPVLDDYPMVSI
ncbi:MAG: poly-beta-1,6 N-acetyl-D-glucosamine synthase, partial [Rhodoferax sp.]|nr:poly-beta-1,6 N-acetyl-D-glucosamine synthase [Rhodoferax sp.]